MSTRQHQLMIWILLLGVLLLAMAMTVHAQQGNTILKRKGFKAEYIDAAWFHASENKYEITKGKATIVYPADEIEYAAPPKPKGLDNAKDPLILEKIIKEYRGLWWDVAAFKQLVPLYVQRGEYEKAVGLFQRKNPIKDGKDIPLALYRVYWQALMLSHKDDQLGKELENAIAAGSRETAAWAYLARGDWLLKKGEARDSLNKGYLPVVLLFKSIEAARKLALKGAIAACDKLGDPQAEEFRKTLKTEYPNAS
jgi:hypothetical protein